LRVNFQTVVLRQSELLVQAYLTRSHNPVWLRHLFGRLPFNFFHVLQSAPELTRFAIVSSGHLDEPMLVVVLLYAGLLN